MRRALLIMDAVLKALEERGHQIGEGPAVSIMGTRVRFSLSEELDIKREEFENDDLEGFYTFRHSQFNETQVPSGRLALKIYGEGMRSSSGCRHTWRDTDKKSLEDSLNRFLVGLMKTAGRIREYEEERRRIEEFQRQEEMRRKAEAKVLAKKREQYKAEKAKFDLLLAQAADRRKSQSVRELIEAAREAYLELGPIEPGSKTANWLEWASQQADRLDPLVESPPSILDEKLEEPQAPERWYRQSW